MAQEAPLYDLTLLLSQNASDEQRAKVLSDVQSTISSAGGSIERDDTWGRRPTAYQIRHQAEAEYHLLQFKAPAQLIEELSHTLRITDGVLRFRVIKVRPGTPAAPSSPPPVVVAATAPSSAAQAAAAASAASTTATAAPPAQTPAQPDASEAQDAATEAQDAATDAEDTGAAEDASAAQEAAPAEAGGAETQGDAAQDE